MMTLNVATTKMVLRARRVTRVLVKTSLMTKDAMLDPKVRLHQTPLAFPVVFAVSGRLHWKG